MARVVKAPNGYTTEPSETIVFLAGSIEMGAAEKWQDKVVNALVGESILFLNPRRDDWDSSWEQSIKNDKFREQVEWELRAMDTADIIVMYFDGNTKSPITLLELGLHARSHKLAVCCPQKFWRKGNVDIVCNRYGVPQFATLQDLIVSLKD